MSVCNYYVYLIAYIVHYFLHLVGRLELPPSPLTLHMISGKPLLFSCPYAFSINIFLYRSLRAVCDSWSSFVEFSMPEIVVDKSSFKKRKVVYEHNSNFQTSLSSIEREYKGDVEYNCRLYGTRGQSFNESRNCLLSLKTSVENLHRKKLFPYNPEVLLKRCVLLLHQQKFCGFYS